MKSWIYSAAVILGMSVSTPLFPADQSPPCYRQIQQTFFREDILTTALSLYSVQQNIWVNIFRDLQRGSSQVPGLVQAYANSKNPNPLDPYNPQEAAKILHQALYDVFYGVMRFYASQNNNIIDINTINGIFRYMWEQQQNSLIACMNSGMNSQR